MRAHTLLLTSKFMFCNNYQWFDYSSAAIHFCFHQPKKYFHLLIFFEINASLVLESNKTNMKIKQNCYSHNNMKFKITKWSDRIAHPQCCKGYKIEAKQNFKAEVKANTASLWRTHTHTHTHTQKGMWVWLRMRCTQQLLSRPALFAQKQIQFAFFARSHPPRASLVGDTVFDCSLIFINLLF